MSTLFVWQRPLDRRLEGRSIDTVICLFALGGWVPCSALAQQSGCAKEPGNSLPMSVLGRLGLHPQVGSARGLKTKQKNHCLAYRALTSSHRPCHLVRKVDVSGSVDQVEQVCFPIRVLVKH